MGTQLHFSFSGRHTKKACSKFEVTLTSLRTQCESSSKGAQQDSTNGESQGLEYNEEQDTGGHFWGSQDSTIII